MDSDADLKKDTGLVGAATTWNGADRIAEHKALSHAERLRRTIEVSRAALRFACGPRRDER